MNNQIDHRLALRALFESSLESQFEEGKLEENLYHKMMAGINQAIGRKMAAAKYRTRDRQGSLPTPIPIKLPLGANARKEKWERILKARQPKVAEPKYDPNDTMSVLQAARGPSKSSQLKAGLKSKLLPKDIEDKGISDLVKQANKRNNARVKQQISQHQSRQMDDDMLKSHGSSDHASTDYSRLGLRALFEAVVISSKKKVVTETKRGTARPAGGGMSTDTGAGDLHPDIKKKVPYQGNVTRFEGDPTSKAAAAAQKTHSTAMDAAFKPSEEEGAPPKNLPPATNRPGKKQAETPGGKATNPLDRPTAGKFTPRQVAAKIAALRGKKS